MSTNRNDQSGAARSRMVARLGAILLVFIALIVLACAGINYYQYWLKEQVAQQRKQELGLVDDEVTDEDKDRYVVDAANKPKLLSIPSIGVDRARVQEVGLLNPSSDGSQQMDVPKNVHDVGWYNCQINPLSDRRCEQYVSPTSEPNGQAVVIDGHSCDGDGCVFDKLSSLQVGDEIVVTMSDDLQITYSVEAVEVVELEDLDMNRVMSAYHTDQRGLNLITCDGSWSSLDSRGVVTMDKRVVVYTSEK